MTEKKVRYSAAMSPSLLERGRKFAMADGRSFSWLVEKALAAYLADAEQGRSECSRKHRQNVRLV